MTKNYLLSFLASCLILPAGAQTFSDNFDSYTAVLHGKPGQERRVEQTTLKSAMQKPKVEVIRFTFLQLPPMVVLLILFYLLEETTIPVISIFLCGFL
jgi:hypothetical protein